jgi:hypothetical protein
MINNQNYFQEALHHSHFLYLEFQSTWFPLVFKALLSLSGLRIQG